MSQDPAKLQPDPANTEEPLQNRRIAHLDMDAFYASVELLKRPDLKGLPVAIGGRGNPDSRGVVTTATYEARAFGIHSGMALRRAASLCPQCIFLPVDFAAYKDYSRRFKDAVRALTPIIEDRGIDEIYIDLSNIPGVQADRGRQIARQLQTAVEAATDGLTCSVGVAPNKLLAKMASEFNKPNGLAFLETTDLAEVVWPMAVRKINGIGPKATEKLNRLGIQTIGELAAAEQRWLIKQFGQSYGPWLHRVAWGRDERPIVTHSEPVSRSSETTFERDMHLRQDRDALLEILDTLTEKLSRDLAKRQYAGSTIGIKVRYTDFAITTRDRSIAQATNDPKIILMAALNCLDRVPSNRRIRLIGVRVGSLQKLQTADHLVAKDAGSSPAARPASTRSNADPYTPDLFGFADPQD
ncbi:MAG: DNA polymerase IV [Burkholderiaceae bacterium]